LLITCTNTAVHGDHFSGNTGKLLRNVRKLTRRWGNNLEEKLFIVSLKFGATPVFSSIVVE